MKIDATQQLMLTSFMARPDFSSLFIIIPTLKHKELLSLKCLKLFTVPVGLNSATLETATINYSGCCTAITKSDQIYNWKYGGLSIFLT